MRTWPWPLLAALLSGCTLAGEPVPAGPIEVLGVESAPSAAVEPSAPAGAPNLAAGAAIYAENCAACHGPAGMGDGELADRIAAQGGNLPNLADPDLADLRSPQQWFEVITNGNIQNLMPPWNSALTDAQRWDVTYYLYTLSLSEAELATGEALYRQNFAQEYGRTGAEIGLDDLAQNAAISRDDLYAAYFAEGSDALSIDERRALAAYAHTLAWGGAQYIAQAEAEAAAAAPAAEDAGLRGQVSGQVLNASSDALPDALEVRLRGFVIEEGQVREFLARSAPLLPNGEFRFEGLPIFEPEAAYIVSVVYQGVEYNNGGVMRAKEQSLDLPVTIYESGSDPAVVRQARFDLVLRRQGENLAVVQLGTYSNLSDEVYVTAQPLQAGRPGSVPVAVPFDAFGVEFGDGLVGERYAVLEAEGIFDMQPLFPGPETKSILVTYFLPFESGARDLAYLAEFPVERVNVLVEEGLNLRSGVLTPAGVEVIDGRAYQRYIAADLPAGETLTLRVQQPARLEDSLPLILGGLLLALVLSGVAYGLIGLRRAGRQGAAGLFGGGEQSLIQEIAALDAAFEAGSIDRFSYEARRAALKAQALQAEAAQQ